MSPRFPTYPTEWSRMSSSSRISCEFSSAARRGERTKGRNNVASDRVAAPLDNSQSKRRQRLTKIGAAGQATKPRKPRALDAIVMNCRPAAGQIGRRRAASGWWQVTSHFSDRENLAASRIPCSQLRAPCSAVCSACSGSDSQTDSAQRDFAG